MRKVDALKIKGLAVSAMEEKHGIVKPWASDTPVLTVIVVDTPENRRKISAVIGGNYAAGNGALFVSGKRNLEAFYIN